MSGNGQQGVNWNQVDPAEPHLLDQAEFQVEFQVLLCQEWETEAMYPPTLPQEDPRCCDTAPRGPCSSGRPCT